MRAGAPAAPGARSAAAAATMYLCRAASQALAARLSRAPSAAGRLQHRGTAAGGGQVRRAREVTVGAVGAVGGSPA